MLMAPRTNTGEGYSVGVTQLRRDEGITFDPVTTRPQNIKIWSATPRGRGLWSGRVTDVIVGWQMLSGDEEHHTSRTMMLPVHRIVRQDFVGVPHLVPAALCLPDRRHELGPSADGRSETLSQRPLLPVLPAERLPHRDPSVARATRRSPAAGASLGATVDTPPAPATRVSQRRATTTTPSPRICTRSWRRSTGVMPRWSAFPWVAVRWPALWGPTCSCPRTSSRSRRARHGRRDRTT